MSYQEKYCDFINYALALLCFLLIALLEVLYKLPDHTLYFLFGWVVVALYVPEIIDLIP